MKNYLADMALLYNVASHRSWKIYNHFGGGTTSFPNEIRPRKKYRIPS